MTKEDTYDATFGTKGAANKVIKHDFVDIDDEHSNLFSKYDMPL